VLAEKGLTADRFAEHLSGGDLISEERPWLIRHGLERYFAEDVVSAIHILALQVEGIVRDAAEILGLPTTSKVGSRHQARRLDSFLQDADVISAPRCRLHDAAPRFFERHQGRQPQE
jgi:hypothetical protein